MPGPRNPPTSRLPTRLLKIPQQTFRRGRVLRPPSCRGAGRVGPRAAGIPTHPAPRVIGGGAWGGASGRRTGTPGDGGGNVLQAGFGDLAGGRKKVMSGVGHNRGKGGKTVTAGKLGNTAQKYGRRCPPSKEKYQHTANLPTSRARPAGSQWLA